MITRLGSALPALPSGAYAEPEWLRIAYNEEQDAPTEKAGLDDNHERILTYLSTASGLATKPVKVPLLKDGKPVFKKDGKPAMTDDLTHMMGSVDETAWCACFVNWCLKEAKQTPIAGAKAEGYARWGGQASVDHVGAICVIKRDPFEDSPGTGWHVGFFIGGSSADGTSRCWEETSATRFVVSGSWESTRVPRPCSCAGRGRARLADEVTVRERLCPCQFAAALLQQGDRRGARRCSTRSERASCQ